MANELYATRPRFRVRWTMRRPAGGAAGASIAGGAVRAEGGCTPLDDTTYTQPALFALEYALATLWQAWGVQPELLIGHSVGELRRLVWPGCSAWKMRVKLIAARGRLMGALPQDGAMVSLQADEEQVQAGAGALCGGGVDCCGQRPGERGHLGRREAVLAVGEQLAAEGVKTPAADGVACVPLAADGADAGSDFRKVAESITYHTPRLRLVSNVTGKLAGER